eukprot:scaffold11350_cov115-Isochrysis_galbana.AAC.1
MNGVDTAGGKCGGEGLKDADGVDDVEDGGESGIALNTPTAAGDIDEFTTGEPKILRDIVGVVGKEVLKEVGVVLFEGVDDGAAVELVESVGAVLGVDGECRVVLKEKLEGAGHSIDAGRNAKAVLPSEAETVGPPVGSGCSDGP